MKTLKLFLFGFVLSCITFAQQGTGMVPGPRMNAGGPARSITGGHCDQSLLPYEWQEQALPLINTDDTDRK